MRSFTARSLSPRSSLARQARQHSNATAGATRRSEPEPPLRPRHVLPGTRDSGEVADICEQTRDDPLRRAHRRGWRRADIARNRFRARPCRAGKLVHRARPARSRECSTCCCRCRQRRDAEDDSGNCVERQRFHEDAIQVRASRMTPRSNWSAVHVVDRVGSAVAVAA